jgi:hypothetical protein
MGGCATVSSVEPLGQHPKAMTAQDWEGTWIHKEGSISIKVLDKDRGRLQVAWAEEKQGRFELESYTVEMLQAGEWLFGNVKDKGRYYWALVRKDGGEIIMWPPAVARFRTLVETGVLPGKVDKDGDVLLAKLAPEHLALILSGDKGHCFEWDKPTVFLRVGK